MQKVSRKKLSISLNFKFKAIFAKTTGNEKYGIKRKRLALILAVEVKLGGALPRGTRFMMMVEITDRHSRSCHAFQTIFMIKHQCQ
jgi:hypothetical protein